FSLQRSAYPRELHPLPTRRSSDLGMQRPSEQPPACAVAPSWPQSSQGTTAAKSISTQPPKRRSELKAGRSIISVSRLKVWRPSRSEEHTSELQSLRHLVCRLLLEK